MNPYANKVIVNGQAIIDLTGDTVTPETLMDGFTAHDKSGAPIIGTAQPSGGDCKHLHTTVSIPYTTAESRVTLLPRSALVEAGILTGANTSLEDEWDRFVVEITISPTGLTRSRMYVFKTISFSLGAANGSISSAGVVSALAYTVRLAKESTQSSASPVVRASNSTLKSEGGYGYPALKPGEGLTSASISTSPTYNGNYTIDVYVAGKK